MVNEFDLFVQRAMPHPIAVQYQKLLEAETTEEKIRHALRVYELSLRALAIGMISQYLIRDADRFNDPALNQLLLTKLPNATLDTWQRIFFSTLKAYEGERNLFFMPELYDFFWDSSITPPQPRPAIEVPFTRLTQIRNDLELGGMLPTDKTGWQALCTETLELLHTVLSQFTFFEHFDLIRIIEREGNLYWYDQYTGLQVIAGQTPLQTEHELSRGWFYLSKQNRDFLELHPLLVFWEEPRTGLVVPFPQRDVAIYDHLIRNRLQYLIANMWKIVTDEKRVTDFVRLLYFTIEQVKRERQQSERLSWWQLQDIARAISERRMASVLDKYRSDLYLQRDKTRAAFEDFLASDKVCFILIGKSGVGKSNFLLALAEEYGQKRPDVCLLVYSGAKPAKESLTTSIGRDFENYLQLTGRSDEEGIINIWREIGRINGIESRAVVLCIDAINENTEAKVLLRQIDDLVEGSPWPWLKVVVTSRPEAWRAIKRGVRLAEARYYREAGGQKLGVEMEPFSYSQELEPFARDELPRAYEKYRNVYDLQTEYDDLSAEVRLALRDPLVLRLVADTYQGRETPPTVEAGKVYQEYIDHLIRTERLTLEDVRFLERELMPLMIREGHYTNTITAQEIAKARTTDGLSLFELIHNEARLSGGRRINQSYVNLVDAEILERRGETQDYEIGFKYERFYDFYAGKLLFERYHNSSRPHEDYRELINFVSALPYLWGATKTALRLELESGNTEVIRQLVRFEDYGINEIIAVTLEELAIDYREEVNSILLELFTRARPTRLKRVWRRMKGTRQAGEESIRRLAIEVAYRIDYDEILALGLRDISRSVRIAAIRYTYYLWHRDKARDWRLMRGLADDMGISNFRRTIQTLFGLTWLIAVESLDRLAVLTALGNMWNELLQGTLLFGHRSQFPQSASRVLINIAISAAVRFVTGAIRPYSVSYPVNLIELRQFFKLSSSERKKIAKVLPYLDPTKDINPDQMAQELLEIGSPVDILSLIFVRQVLIVQGSVSIERILPTVRLFCGKGCDEGNILRNYAILTLFFALYKHGEVNFQYFELFENLFDQFVRDTRAKCHTPSATYRFDGLSLYGALHHKVYQTIEIPLINRYASDAYASNDQEFLAYVIDNLGLMAMNFPHTIGPALRAFQHIIELGPLPDDSIEDMVRNLASLRNKFPSEVLDFVSYTDVPAEIRISLERRRSEESISDISHHSGELFLAALLFRYPQVRSLVAGLALKAIECESLEQWLGVLVKTIVNLTVGKDIFEIGA